MKFTLRVVLLLAAVVCEALAALKVRPDITLPLGIACLAGAFLV